IKSLAGWLHHVAQQTAMNVRSKSQRSQSLGRRMWTAAQLAREDNPDRTELYAVLDEELVGLPEKLRVPLVLHYLKGVTQNEIARMLGCSRSVVRKRLAKGEALLRERLERRGLTVGAWSLAVLLGGATAGSAMPAPLVFSTVKAALVCPATPAADGFLSAWAARWAEGI